MGSSSHSSANGVVRVLPHSLEAEEHLLSNCMLDGAAVVEMCMASHITPESFYDLKHAYTFEVILDLHRQGRGTEIYVVAEEMKSRATIDRVGGYAFLTQVSSVAPTTALAKEWVSKVSDYATRRLLIRSFTGFTEEAYNGSVDVADILRSITSKVETIQGAADTTDETPAVGEFPLPPTDDPKALIGKNRYISRGDGAVLVSSSGMGKSVMGVEWAMVCALGRPYLGIPTHGKLTSLIIQSEDSDGDIGEIVFSVRTALKLTDEEFAEVNKRVFFVRDKTNSGEAFIRRLRRLVKKIKPDLVWINPLHAYAGCDIADAREMGRFLRAGLHGVNKDEKFAYMIIHHTPKPITGKGIAEKKWSEFMYDAAGSAELVNWARVVITLKPTEEEGKFNLILAKRGRRAGVYLPAPGQDEETATRFELTTKVPIQHSTKMVNVDGRKEPFAIVHWETRKPDPEQTANGRARPTAYQNDYEDKDLVCYYPPQSDEGHSFSAISRAAAEGCNISKSGLWKRNVGLRTAELVEQMEDGRWRRTTRGDDMANEVLKKRL